MFDNFETYYYENVLIPYFDYMGQKNTAIYGRSRDLKLAISSATALFHLREHLPPQVSMSREEVQRLCSSYSIIGDVVNASKHRDIERNNPSISHASQIQEILVTTLFNDEQGNYTYKDKVINIQLNSGENVLLHKLLYEVIEFWDKYLFEKNILTKRTNFMMPNDDVNRSREDCSNLDIEIVSGLPFQMIGQLKQYDYATNKIEAVNLTDAKIKMNIYKPLEIDLTITNHKTKKTVVKTITLSAEDTKKYNSLVSDLEKENFLNSLDYVKELSYKMLKELE